MDHDPAPAKNGASEHVGLLAEGARHRSNVVVGIDAAAAAGLGGEAVFIGAMQAGAGQPESGTGLALCIECGQGRPQRFSHRRLKPSAGPCVIGVPPPEAVPDGRVHAGVWTGASSSLSIRCGSRSGASSGSDAGSGISTTLTGLLVNPIRDPSLTLAKSAGRRGRRIWLGAARTRSLQGERRAAKTLLQETPV